MQMNSSVYKYALVSKGEILAYDQNGGGGKTKHKGST